MKLLSLSEKAILFLVLTSVPMVIYYRVGDPNIVKELIFKILVLTWGIILCLKYLRTKQLTFFPTRLAFGVVLFLVISVSSLIFSDYKAAGAGRVELIGCFVSFFFLVSQAIRDQETAVSALEVAAFGAFLVSIYGIIQFFGIDFFAQGDLSRVFSTFGHPNFLASYLVCTIPLTIGLILSARKNVRKYYYALSVAIQSTCLILTLTRAAIASAIASLIFFAIIYLRQNGKTKLFGFSKKKLAVTFLIACVSAGILLSIAWKLPESEISRLTELGTRSKGNTLWLRWLEWKGTLQVIEKAPIAGNGLGTFSIFFPPNQPPEFSTISTERDEFLRHAHNEYLELWCEMGIFGPIVFALILVIAIGSGLRLIKSRNGTGPSFWLLGLVSGLFGLGIHMFFSVSFRFMVTPLMFWFYLGIINGLCQTDFGKVKTWEHGKAKALVTLFLIIVVIFLSLSLADTIAAFRSEKDFYKGLVDWNSGRFKEALSHMEIAHDDNETKPEILYKKGGLEVRLEKWADALKTYRILEKIHPNFFHVNYNLSICYLNMGDMKNAIASGKRQIELYPDFAEQYFLLGKAYYNNNNGHDAEKCFENYLKRNPNDASTLSYLGNIYAFRSEWKKAISKYNQVLADHPDDLRVRLNISQAYLKTDDLEKACENLSIILEERDKSSFFQEQKESIDEIVEKLIAKRDKKALDQSCPYVVKYIKSRKKPQYIE